MILHLGRAPDQYDYRDQNIMRRTIEAALRDTVDGTSSNMGDIIVTNPTNGEVLIYSDGAWINHALVLDDLDDVVSPSPTSGHYLYYNGSNWVDRQIVTEDIEVPSENVGSHTLSQFIDEQAAVGWDNGGDISLASSTTIDVAAGAGFFTDTTSIPNDLYYVEWYAQAGISVTSPGSNSIGIKWDGPGTDPYVVVKLTDDWNYLTEWPLGTVVVSASSGIEILFNHPFLIRGGTRTIHWRFKETNNFERANDAGMIIGETDDGVDYRYITMTDGYLWAGLRREYADPVNTLTDANGMWFAWYHSGSGLEFNYDERIWAATSAYTAQPDLQLQWLWNDATDAVNPLKQLATNKWCVFWFIITEEGYPIAGFHDTEYNTEAQAEEAPLPSHYSEQRDQLIAKLVFQQGQDTAAHIYSLWGGETGSAGTLVSDHGNLAGLHDDDHTQYLHLSNSRVVTAQHNFTVYGTGDWLAGEWDLLIGDTVTNAGGAINVGGAAYSLAGNMGSIGTPGIDLDGSVISSNRGSGPSGNVEFGWTDSTDEIRFALAKSGAGFGTYNPRSMIIAGPAVADDDIVTGSYWGFTNLPMDTATYGADCGIQHDCEILGKLWVDTIASSSAGTITFDEPITTQTLHVTDTDNVELHLEATGVDSTAWVALENDAREYRLRITGANELDIYDVTAAATRIVMDTAGDVTFNGDVDTQNLTATFVTAPIGSFTSYLTLTGPIYQAQGAVLMHRMYNSGGAADTRQWEIQLQSSGDLEIHSTTDAGVTVHTALSLAHASGRVTTAAQLRATGRLYALATDDVDLVGISGGLIVGGDGSGSHLAFDANEVMAKGSATTTATLYLNAEGGNVVIGTSADGIAWNESAARLAPQTSGGAALGSSGTRWGDAYLNDLYAADGTFSAGVAISGLVTVGVADTTRGEIRCYGHATGSTNGGIIRFYTAADYDTNVNYYSITASGEDLYIGAEADEILRFDWSDDRWESTKNILLTRDSINVILATATLDGGGRPRITFSNNSQGLFLGDDHDDQTFNFAAAWEAGSTYGAKLRIAGPGSNYGSKNVTIYHDGTDGQILTDTGDLVLAPTASVLVTKQFEIVRNDTVMVRMQHSGGTVDVRQWDNRIQTTGIWELRSVTDAGATTQTVISAAHATGNFRIHHDLELDGALNHDGSTVGFYATAPVAQQTGVAVTAAAIHAALVNLGLITA